MWLPLSHVVFESGSHIFARFFIFLPLVGVFSEGKYVNFQSVLRCLEIFDVGVLTDYDLIRSSSLEFKFFELFIFQIYFFFVKVGMIFDYRSASNII